MIKLRPDECACCYGKYGARKYRFFTAENTAKMARDMTKTVAGNLCPDCLAGVLGEIIERLSEWDPVLAKEVIEYTIRRKRLLDCRRAAREARIEAREHDQAEKLRRMVAEDEAERQWENRELAREARAERIMWAGQA